MRLVALKAGHSVGPAVALAVLLTAATMPARAQGVQCEPAPASRLGAPTQPPTAPAIGASRQADRMVDVGMQPVCPAGQIPVVKPVSPDGPLMMKGNPLLHQDSRG